MTDVSVPKREKPDVLTGAALQTLEMLTGKWCLGFFDDTLFLWDTFLG